MADAPRTVLVADDQPDVIAALRLLLRSAGFDAEAASSVAEVRARVTARDYDAVVMDLNYARDTTSGAEGLDLITDLHAVRPDLPLIAMTGWANIDTAVEAMRRGARGYVPKPWSNDALLQVLRDEIAHTHATRSAKAGAARERRDAQAIQRALLPETLPSVPGIALAVRWQPAAELGGDYYDVFQLDAHRMAVCIGDVCGKGLPAALLVSNLQATVRAVAGGGVTPRGIVARVNAALCGHGDHGRFATLVIAILDTRERTVAFCNAGHNAPLLMCANGSARRLETGGVVTGLFDTANYEDDVVALETGDRLLFFTDGLVEAGDAGTREYGDERLVASLARRRHLEVGALVNGVFDDVQAWAGGHFDDDATALVLGAEA